VMALWFENGDTSSAFLARDAVPGRPELNQMNTPLVMNAVQTAGAACPSAGAIARTSDGGLLTCKSGLWTEPTGEGGIKCEVSNADLNTLQEDKRCYNGSTNPNSPAPLNDWIFVEVFRHPNPANYYVMQRVTGMSGTSWGKVWVRHQQSGAATGGWSSWNQIADPNVRVAGGGVTATGTVQGSYIFSTGNVSASNVVVSNNGMYTWSNSNWAFLGGDSSGNWYTSPGSHIGSAYLNDAYFRSAGRWASQLAGGRPLYDQMVAAHTGYGGCWWLPGYGIWATYIGSIDYWPGSHTSGAGGPYAIGVYGGGNGWCAGTWSQLMGFAWRVG